MWPLVQAIKRKVDVGPLIQARPFGLRVKGAALCSSSLKICNSKGEDVVRDARSSALGTLGSRHARVCIICSRGSLLSSLGCSLDPPTFASAIRCHQKSTSNSNSAGSSVGSLAPPPGHPAAGPRHLNWTFSGQLIFGQFPRKIVPGMHIPRRKRKTAKETENRQGEVGSLRYSPYGP
jgi:hypothetical protein